MHAARWGGEGRGGEGRGREDSVRHSQLTPIPSMTALGSLVAVPLFLSRAMMSSIAYKHTQTKRRPRNKKALQSKSLWPKNKRRSFVTHNYSIYRVFLPNT
ncbi:hypothetical protein BHE74_00047713 [Ensete ventricosum]|nr:hypothetical protein BHE74_00047713 [Ensete ventricosum]